MRQSVYRDIPEGQVLRVCHEAAANATFGNPLSCVLDSLSRCSDGLVIGIAA